jgi:hypothetical protein
MRNPVDDLRVWWLLEFVIRLVVIDRRERRRSRRRERVFAATHLAVAQHRADQTRGGLDYFVDPPRRSV